MNKQQINYTTTLLGAVVSTTTCFIKAIFMTVKLNLYSSIKKVDLLF